MAEILGLDADIYFGDVDKPLPDWRNDPEWMAQEDPDDELEPGDPNGAIAILGYDPFEEEGEKGGPGSGSWEAPGQPRFAWGGGSEETDVSAIPKLTDMDDKGSIGISVDPSVRQKLATAAVQRVVEEGVAKIPVDMRVAGGASRRMTIIDKPKDAPKTAQAHSKPAGMSPASYIKIYSKKKIEDEHDLQVTAVHEYGHAVDHWLGIKNNMKAPLSDHRSFKTAFDKDFAGLGDKEKFWTYPHVSSSSKEAFAEIYAHVAGMTREGCDDIEQKFPNTTAWMKALFAKRSAA